MPAQRTSSSTIQPCGDSTSVNVNYLNWTIGNTITTTTPVTLANNALSLNYNSKFNNVKYAKDGEIYIDSNGESFIYFSESDNWIKCEIEEIRKEIDAGIKKNIFVISFECTVSEMKKREKERTVFTEKTKKPIIIFTTSNTGDWTTSNIINTINMPQWIYTNTHTGTSPYITTPITTAVPSTTLRNNKNKYNWY